MKSGDSHRPAWAQALQSSIWSTHPCASLVSTVTMVVTVVPVAVEVVESGEGTQNPHAIGHVEAM